MAPRKKVTSKLLREVYVQTTHSIFIMFFIYSQQAQQNLLQVPRIRTQIHQVTVLQVVEVILNHQAVNLDHQALHLLKKVNKILINEALICTPLSLRICCVL